MKIVESFSERLKQALELRDLKPTKLSELSNINKSTISQYIQGVYQPKRARIELFAKILNVNEAWLTGYDVPMERNNQDNRFLSLKSNGRKQYENFMQEATMYFNDEKISLEDKEKIFQSLQDVFFEVKLLNKREKK
ncbi:DNA-binding helix-turn-helix protein [Fusobacterium necrophorum subsp. funduliforme ATCC 51357]|uniref:helix-turn-helix domain-containing protein n=1 Tax=Fusobacterium necrophorum TaxID=859 RepID=UPI00025E6B0D|nr:helix-turn-helix domain-containing protein [Fusobacterium necrophorum]EIJ70675.1 DNA-binding helix-turn-helix protein [Fusobacterium necrophorum subsp. funduliforme ATCC 51357]KAB0552229.1 helix-turn-helix domain-containing protein [Fusobacterium necrophorum subsp. funduliforme]KYM52835.1 transcriptional regulator [Fusobacterium necrophorum subsp. funduliforme]KYM59781.1 transcriptional regulator [Fusobacterium necrophorum subsp. funduliforme]